MKEKLKTVYYCEFCKKYRLTRLSMQNHETRCTLNPGRVCGVRGCKGDCPWCDFSRKRLVGEYVDSVISDDMQKWWAKKGN